MNSFQLPSPLEELRSDFLTQHELRLFVKRDDLIHPEVSGNKWRKLKWNIREAQQQGMEQLLTFGGAYSNHLLATAVAGRISGLKTVGIIRGERAAEISDTLKDCEENGMQLHFISRSDYNKKEDFLFIEALRNQLGSFYLVPEGGANELGVKGCEELMLEVEEEIDVVCCAAGTGTTFVGLCNSLSTEKLEVFPALKGIDYYSERPFSFLKDDGRKEKIEFISDYHFGGYAKTTPELIDFVNDFYQSYQLQLDLVYTAKMFYGIFDRIRKGKYSKGTKIMAIHTGGLQGNRGMEKRLNVQLFS